jgi:hypothetical protein
MLTASPQYDLLNHLLSLNTDRAAAAVMRSRCWRWPGRSSTPKTGTGDRRSSTTGRRRTRADLRPTSPVSRQAVEKSCRRGRTAPRSGLRRRQRLPSADGTFEVVTVAFGLRNATDFRPRLAEMTAWAPPGGRSRLEFSRPRHCPSPGVSGLFATCARGRAVPQRRPRVRLPAGERGEPRRPAPPNGCGPPGSRTWRLAVHPRRRHSVRRTVGRQSAQILTPPLRARDGRARGTCWSGRPAASW